MTPIPLHKVYALGLFRSSVFFVFAVAAFTEQDKHTGAILIAIVFLVDVASWHICEAVNINASAVYNQTWFNVLANRFIFEKILDRFRDRQQIDYESIVKEGTKAASADIVVFLKDHTIWSEWGGFKKTIAGIGYFLWWWISYGIFYGLASFIGSAGRGSY